MNYFLRKQFRINLTMMYLDQNTWRVCNMQPRSTSHLGHSDRLIDGTYYFTLHESVEHW